MSTSGGLRRAHIFIRQRVVVGREKGHSNHVSHRVFDSMNGPRDHDEKRGGAMTWQQKRRSCKRIAKAEKRRGGIPLGSHLDAAPRGEQQQHCPSGLDQVFRPQHSIQGRERDLKRGPIVFTPCVCHASFVLLLASAFVYVWVRMKN